MSARKKTKPKRTAPTKKSDAKKAGRPMQYAPEIAEKAALLAGEGKSDIEIYKKLKIPQSTWFAWKRTIAELREAVRAEREAYQAGRTRASMVQRSWGYTLETVTEQYAVPDGRVRPVMVGKTVTRRQIPADVQAARLVLANMGPVNERWMDKQRIDVGGVVNVNEIPGKVRELAEATAVEVAKKMRDQLHNDKENAKNDSDAGAAHDRRQR